MSLKGQLQNKLPGVESTIVLIPDTQRERDIINYMLEAHVMYAKLYDRLYPFFDTGSLYSDCKKIWEFLKYNFNYNAEVGEDQTVRSPQAILASKGLDCKHYSLFIAGILDALERRYGGFEWAFCFASEYDVSNATHVFVIAWDTKQEIWIDPCLASFDKRKKYILKKEFSPMLSLINGPADESPVIDVDKTVAWQSFLALVALNFLGIRDLLKNDQYDTNNGFRLYCEKNGYDFKQFLNYIR